MNPHKIKFDACTPGVQATLLRGLCAQVQQMVLPTIRVVKDTASSIGLVVLSKEEYKELINSDVDSLQVNLANFKRSVQTAALDNNLTDNQKLIKILELLK